MLDEQANVVLVLRTSEHEDRVREILPRLELVLSAHATDAVPQGSGNAASASGKYDLDSKTIAANTFEELVTVAEKTYIVWRPTLHLSRPRVRLQRPAIYFTANLTFANESTKGSRGAQHDYLDSFEPLPANVLEPLQFDPALKNTDVSLPESRITKVAPRAPRLHDLVKPIRGATRRAFPAVPALFTKIRYSALPDAIVASLHLETSQIIAGVVTVHYVAVEVANARVEHLTDVNLPLATQGGDETVVVYKIYRDRAKQTTADGDTRTLTVSVSAKALLDQGSTIDFELKWQAQVNLSTPLGNSSSYRWSRPLSVPSLHKRGSSVPSSSGVLSNEPSQKSTADEAGILISISGPATVANGSDFIMSLQCCNRSSRARRFAVVMLHPRLGNADPKHTAVVDAGLIAKVFNAPPMDVAKRLDVVDLSPEVRIGPLASGACFETQLKFRTMSTGVLNLGTMRVLDLDTRQVVDVRELPDIVALG